MATQYQIATRKKYKEVQGEGYSQSRGQGFFYDLNRANGGKQGPSKEEIMNDIQRIQNSLPQ